VTTSTSNPLREALPLCRDRSYFFAGAQGPLGTEVRRAMVGALDRWDQTGWHIHETEWAQVADTYHELAAFLGCDQSQVVHTEGTSDSMNRAAATVLARWRRSGSPRANVVLHHQLHAAGSYAWLSAVRLGADLDLRWADPTPEQTGLDAICELVDGETLAVVTSHVSNWDGERIDLEGLAARFPDRSFALLTDAAQSGGALDMSDTVATCDFVGIPAYKWLLGPPGLGYLTVGARWLDDLGPPTPGWAGMREPLPIRPREVNAAPNAASYRLGIPNFIGLAGAAAALHLLNEVGAAPVEHRIRDLTERLVDEVGARRLEMTTPADWTRRAGVITVRVPEPRAVAAALEADGVVVGVELDQLRLDVHAYNTEDDLDRLLQGLDRRAARSGAH
jgi:cysteine desulfurase / selenocysteine lyase